MSGNRTLGPVTYRAAMVGRFAPNLCRVVIVTLAGLAVIAAIVTTVHLILFVAVIESGHRHVEERITGALNDHYFPYAPAQVVVTRRQDWNAGQRDFSLGGQVCFEIDLSNASGRPDRRVAMVADDNDGGAFYFSREYDSFSECTADFIRG